MNKFDSDAPLAELRAAYPGSLDDGAAIRFLKDRGLSIVQSTIVYAKWRNMTMDEAKEIVADNPVWHAQVVAHAKFHDDLERHAAD